jgi:cytochrome c oxidase assembly factor CtaG
MIARLVAGALAVGAALAPPLHHAAEELMAAHMVQHLLLVSLAAPLLVAGLTPLERLAPLGRPTRRAVGRWIGRARRRLPHARAGGITLVGGWLAHTGVLWAWHAPALYDAALRRPSLHALEHASLLTSAIVFWAAVLPGHGRRERRATGALLALFAGAGQSTALGALLTLAAEPSYASHTATASAWGLTALDDQHLAGLLMWVAGGLGYMAAALVVVARLLRERDGGRRSPAFAVHPRRGS